MRQNTLLKTTGFSTHGVSKPITISSEIQAKELTTCLKMASGFGGSNAALVLRKLGSVGSRKPDNLTVKQSNSQTIQPSNPSPSESGQAIHPNNPKTTPFLPLGEMSEGQRGYITTYCHIKNNKIYLNGALLFEDKEAAGLNTFIKKAFRHFKPKYPKFFKMDDISKLGFLASEVLLTDKPNTQFTEDEVGVILSNAQSTFITDTRFQESIRDDDNFFPSPAVFVYTLPNIMIGEISIRHKLRGANAFFIFAAFNAGFLTEYINGLFHKQKAKACIGGWVDESEDNYEAFVYWTTTRSAQKNKGKHMAEEVKRLYNSIE
jgi:hypothetical protein